MAKFIDSLPLQYYAFSGLFNFITAGIMSIVVLLSNKEAKTNRVFAAFSFSVAYWSILYFAWLSAKNESLAEFYLRSCMIGVLFMPSLFVHFVYLFLKREGSKIFLIFNYSLSIIFTLTVYTPLYAKDIGSHLVFPYWLHTGIAFHLALLHFGAVVSYSFYLMWDALKTETGVFKNQILYVFIGTAIGYIAGVTNFFGWYRIGIPPFLNILVSVYVIMVALAVVVLRTKLMDINLALIRTGVLIFVYLFILGIPFWIGNRLLGNGKWVSILIFGMSLATLGPFIYTFLSRRTENVVFREQRRYQKIIKNLSKIMINIRDLKNLLETVTSTIKDAVRVTFAAIYIKNSEYNSFQLKYCYPGEEKTRFQELIPFDHSLIKILDEQESPLHSEEIGHQDKIDLGPGLVIPCFGKEGLLAIIVLGEKPGKQMYTSEDMLTFETLSNQTALAIENSQFWREIEDRHRKARLQEMDTFSYSLAHEIDNPMTFVYNLARFLKGHFLKYITEQDERKEVEEACAYIMEGSERVMSMVKAIRQFGQKTTGELETLNLQEVIEGFFKLYAPELKANFVICAKEMPDDAIYVKGVAAELQQVLMIFSKNSIHAMNYSQEKKLTLKLTKLNHSTARIAVSDTGCGIKKENLHTIFEPFFTTKASTEGTGMGLHNAKGFVLRHNGKIWAESEGEGRGANFIFELPILHGVNSEDFKKKEKTDWAY